VDRPFRARLEFSPLGGVGLGHFQGTIDRAGRTRNHARGTRHRKHVRHIELRRVAVDIELHNSNRQFLFRHDLPKLRTAFQVSHPGENVMASTR
jgi:hypothetical protein